MLWTIFFILLIAWLIAFLGFHVVVPYIHILLAIAVVILVIALIRGQRSRRI
jgi:hypothetical protein